MIGDSLDVINSLSGVAYDSLINTSETNRIGLVAEDVLPVLPYVVSTSASNVGDVCVGIDYTRLTAVLIEAVKELRTEVYTLKQSLSSIL